MMHMMHACMPVIYILARDSQTQHDGHLKHNGTKVAQSQKKR